MFCLCAHIKLSVTAKKKLSAFCLNRWKKFQLVPEFGCNQINCCVYSIITHLLIVLTITSDYSFYQQIITEIILLNFICGIKSFKFPFRFISSHPLQINIPKSCLKAHIIFAHLSNGFIYSNFPAGNLAFN